MTEVRVIETREDGIVIVLLQTADVKVKVSNMGNQILSIEMKDKNGNFGDIVCGPADPANTVNDTAFLGAVVGRIANRIKEGKFELNGETYSLVINNGKNHLHGGTKGFNQKLCSYELGEDSVTFECFSPDMEEGYPGNLTLRVTYQLVENAFTIHYHAVTDKDTIVGLTNHTYFNLSGKDQPIWDHDLWMDSDSYMPVDDGCLVTGEVAKSAGTPFDFSVTRKIGPVDLNSCDQIRYAKGYDHPIVFKGEKDQIRLSHEETGRMVTMSTDCPMVHLYTGNYLSGGAEGKFGKPYDDWTGVALETELCPDSIHVEKEPAVILRTGEEYRSYTKYVFDVMK